jgi:hypothetical protein
MPAALVRARAFARPHVAVARRVRCHADPPKFSKIEGDKRVVRGKVFVCLDVRATFSSAATCPAPPRTCVVLIVRLRTFLPRLAAWRTGLQEGPADQLQLQSCQFLKHVKLACRTLTLIRSSQRST